MRTTIADLEMGAEEHHRLSDRGYRRYHVFSFDLDYSNTWALMPPKEHWDEGAKARHKKDRQQEIERLKQNYGVRHIDVVIENSIALGPKPMTLRTHHSTLLQQVRRAFIAGAHYPALVAACTLGERILNHLILDLRESFKDRKHYKSVRHRKRITKWEHAVRVLTNWGVLVDGVGKAFLDLKPIRDDVIHFNPATDQSVREKALDALKHLDKIIGKQFGYFGGQPWFIEGTPGAQFIKKTCETDPFVKTYLIPQSAFVGPLHAMELTPQGWHHLDYNDYFGGTVELTDEKFATLYMERDPGKVITREIIDRHQLGKANRNK